MIKYVKYLEENKGNILFFLKSSNGFIFGVLSNFYEYHFIILIYFCQHELKIVDLYIKYSLKYN